jgi:hypothetical protein
MPPLDATLTEPLQAAPAPDFERYFPMATTLCSRFLLHHHSSYSTPL